MSDKIHVAIADDHTLFREGLAGIIGGTDDFQVSNLASTTPCAGPPATGEPAAPNSGASSSASLSLMVVRWGAALRGREVLI